MPSGKSAPRRTPAHLLFCRSLDLSLPLMLATSPWAASSGAPANATLVAFHGRRSARHDLSACVQSLASAHKNSSTRLWFSSSTDRGRCCDGGQLRDPRLLRHHFLVVSGERARGPWLFREISTRHKWRAPATRDTSPRIRCFDEASDVVLPPPAFLRLSDSDEDESAATRPRDVLVMHAEGGSGPPEYELRRAVTEAWAPDWWRGAAQQRQVDALAAEGVSLAIRKVMSRDEHERAMQRAQYCLVVEGYAPWTPRLTEAVKAGCIPVILSPSYRPPFAAIFDWRKFAVFLAPNDIPRIPYILRNCDYAALRANLLTVRKLFSYCLPPFDCNGDDALPLVIFEMARRHQRVEATSRRHFYRTGDSVDSPNEPALSHDKATSARSASFYLGPDTVERGTVTVLSADNYKPRRRRLDFACRVDGRSCVYELNGELWNCSVVNSAACACRQRNVSAPWRA